MVVLEDRSMISTANNQYLQPDYLSSLPTTLDAKKSPLALLAQTCSQIGADTPIPKSLISPNEKSKKLTSTENIRISPTERPTGNLQGLSSAEIKLPFKPHEKKVIIRKSDSHRGKCTVKDYVEEKNTEKSTSGRETDSPATSSCITPNCEYSKNSSEEKSKTPSTRSTTPVNTTENDILQEPSNNIFACSANSTERPSSSSGNLSSSCCSLGLEQSNPAFRPSFPGASFNFQQNAVLISPNTSAGSYSNYVTVKTPSGGEGLVPVCKDPYCTGCQFNLHYQQVLLNSVSGSCPSGCNQCDHQKYNLAMAMSFVPGTIASSLTYTPFVRPYICNWISADTYCGKRFITSEELLQHLRSHTNGIESASVTTSSSMLNPLPLFTSTSLHRSGYLSSINPLSSVRYHPYSKAALQTLNGSYYSAFSPTVFGSYFSPYTVFNQRLGPAAVHP